VLQPVSARLPKPKKSSALPVAIAVAAVLIVGAVGAFYYFFVLARRPATLFLAANPADATVVLDDEKQSGTPPMTLQLRPGAHVLEVSKPGYLPFAQTIEAKAGQRLERIVQLEAIGAGAVKPPEPPAVAARGDAGAPPAVGPVAAAVKARFTSVPSGAKVYLVCDGKRTYQGSTPYDSKLDPGKQCSVSLELGGHKPYVQELQTEGKTQLNVDAVLEKSEEVKLAVGPKEKPVKPLVEKPIKEKPIKEKPVKEKPVKEKPIKERPIAVKPPKEEGPDVKPPTAATKTGYLRINSKPWTRIYIDGRDTGLTTPQTKISLPAGRHSVTLVNNPFNIKHSFSITIQAGETATKVLDLRNPEQQNE
jgi:serine/threonine-protein kinase